MGVVLADNVSAVKLVGNLDSESSGDLTIGEYQTSTGVGAQAFTTGNNPEGYVITGVEINVSVASSNRTALVSIQSSNNSKLYDLTGSVTSAGVQSFTAPENATLNASTTYFLHIAPGTGTLNFKVGVTDSDSEDSASASGWSVENVSLHSMNNGSSFTINTDSLQLAVYGDAVSINPEIPTNSFDLDSSNSNPFGLWSDGETLWVSDESGNKAYAYTFAEGSLTYDSSKDFSTVASPDGAGVNANNDIIYLLRPAGDFLTAHAYNFSGDRQNSKDVTNINITFNAQSTGLWADSTTIWITGKWSDPSHFMYGYNLNGTRNSNKDILIGSCINSYGAWSDEETIWVIGECTTGGNKIRAFNLSDGARDSARDIPISENNTQPRGLWSDGEFMWTANNKGTNDKVYSYKYRNNSYGLRIQGSPVTGHTLSADSSSITDPNGLPDSPDFSYQWQYDDGTDIAGATSKTYRLRASDVGKKIQVRVRFIDNARYDEELYSESFEIIKDKIPTSSFDLDSSNSNPFGLWSDGETLWVSDESGNKAYAYTFAEGSLTYDSSKDFSTIASPDGAGVNANNDIIYLLRPTGDFLTAHAYNFSGDRQNSKDVTNINITFNAQSTGLWADSTTIWITGKWSDPSHFVYGYNLNGTRNSNKDILIGSCINSYGAWSDEETIWVIGNCITGGNKIRAFNLSDGARDSARDISISENNTQPRGLWSDGEFMWTANNKGTNDKVYSYKYRNNAEGLRIQGSPITGHTLSADIASITEPNGLPDSPEFSYQWQYADGTDIAGAISKTYYLKVADAGKKVRVRVSFTDNARYEEEIFSEPTGTIQVNELAVFGQSEYIFYLDENRNGSGVNAITLGRITVTDKNKPSGVGLFFTESSSINSNDGKFRITGETTDTFRFQYRGTGEEYNETKNKYVYTITTFNNNNFTNSTSVNVTIYINDPNEAPVFEHLRYFFYLDKNKSGKPTPVELGTITVTDNKDPDGVTLFFPETNSPSSNDGKFRIIGETTDTFRFQYRGTGEEYNETKDRYVYTIAALDNNNNIAYMNVTVLIRNSTEPPVFDQREYVFYLDVNISGPVEMGTITLTDNDDSNGITLFFTEINSVNSNDGKFRISGGARDTFRFQYKGTGETDETNKYVYTIEAIDDRDNSAYANVTIYIINPNAPVFSQKEYVFYLDENQIGNDTPIDLGTISATDNDDPDGFAFSFANDSNDTFTPYSKDNKFRIKANTTTSSTFRYVGDGEEYNETDETKNKYVYTIITSDNNLNYAYATVTVYINDPNEASVFDQSEYIFYLDENRSGSGDNPITLGTINLNVNGIAGLKFKDGDNTLSSDSKFKIKSISDNSFEFRYIGTGEEYNETDETKNIYEYPIFTVYVGEDNGNSTTKLELVNVTINIREVEEETNEAPVFINTAYFALMDENRSGNQTPLDLITISATDNDDTNGITFFFSETNSNNSNDGKFRMAEFGINTVVLQYIGTGEDYDSENQYVYIIGARDDNNNTAYVNVTVDIKDPDNSPPVFNQSEYVFYLDENRSGSGGNAITLGTITLTDKENEQVALGFIGTATTYSSDNKFHIEHINGNSYRIRYVGTGEDYETTNEYVFGIFATDRSNNVVRTNVTVYINNPNEPIRETNDTLVSNLNQARHFSSFGFGSTRLAQGFTTGNNSLGYVLEKVEISVTNGNFFRGVINTHTAIYSASGNNPGTKLYNLTGNNVSMGYNEFTAPENTVLNASTSYFFVIEKESYSNSRHTFNLEVTNSNDEDSGASVGWSIKDKGQTQSVTNPGSWSSELYIQSVRTNTSLKMAVYGEEKTNSPPVFSGSSTFTVNEHKKRVGTVMASDEDVEDSITGYSISGGEDSGSFRINNNGVLHFIPTPNFESPSDVGGDNEYKVSVQVTSGTGSRLLTTNKEFTINVNDLNEPPSTPAKPTLNFPTSTSLLVNWVAPSNKGPAITDYDVEYREEDSSGSFSTWTHNGAVTSTTITNLSTNTTYYVQVRAENAEGTSGWSPVANGTTGGAQLTPEISDVEASDITADGAKITVIVSNPDGNSKNIYYRVWAIISDHIVDSGVVNTSTSSATFRLTGLNEGYRHDVDVSFNENFPEEETLHAQFTPKEPNNPPILTKNLIEFNLSENANGNSTPFHIGRVKATDPDGDPLNYTLVRTHTDDIDKFTINSTSGDVYYTGSGEDYETKRQYFLLGNLYDGVNEPVYFSITIEIINNSDEDGNNPPEFTSSSTFSVNENNINVGTVTATDSDTEDSVTDYNISGGADSTNFSITNGGVLTFNSAPDFENPSDSNSDNEYEVQVTATSGTGSRVMTATQDIIVTVNNVSESTSNNPPEFTSSPTFSVNENNINVGTVTATDSDTEDSVTDYNISGGADNAGLSITGDGVLTFNSAPDFENPSDSNSDNEYEVQVTATSGTGSRVMTTTQDIIVTVNNVSESTPNNPPEFTSSPTFSVNENNINVGTVTATDSDTEDSVTDYNISGGADNAGLSITNGGVLTFKSAPDFENADDDDSNNEYEVQVTATSGTGSRVMTTTQDITVTVNNVSESTTNLPPTFSIPHTTFYIDENTIDVGTIVTSDPDIQDRITGYRFINVSNFDQELFQITNEGVLTFKSAPDYENPSDYDGDNTYQFRVQVSSGIGSRRRTKNSDVYVLVDNVSDEIVNNTPAFTSNPTFSVNENNISVGTVTASDSDTEDSVTGYNISGGADNARLSITGDGILTFVSAPDFENPNDDDSNNEYVVQVTATSGTGSRVMNATQNITVTVNDVNEAPSTPSAPTLSSPTPNSLSVSWSAPDNTGPDINDYDVQYRKGSSGAFTNRTHTDNSTSTTITGLDANTQYQVRILAHNDEGASNWSQTSDATTSPVPNNQPTFTSNPTFSVNENNISVGTVVASDTDTEDSVTGYIISGGTDRSMFSITNSGVLTFQSNPDYENPSDVGTNNNYAVEVTATSGANSRVLTETQNIVVTVDDVNEAPSTPSAPTLSSPTPNSLSVSWSAPDNTGPDINDYDVQYRKGSSGAFTNRTHTDNSTSTTITGLDANTQYQVRILAHNDEGASNWSQTSDATTSPVPNNQPTFTSNPTFSVNENNISVGTVVASDTDTEDSVTGYIISGGTDRSMFSITNSGVLTFQSNPDYENPSDVGTNNNYAVEVTATSGANSRVLTETQNIVVTVDDVNEAPSTPSAPTLSSPTPNSLFVSWTAPDNTGPDINDYDVQYRKGSSGSFTNRTHTDDSTNTTITSLDANTSYQVRILARNDEGGSNWSPTASFTTSSINSPPTFTSSPTFSVNENNINVGTVTANDSDTEDSVTNYSISGGADNTRFSITNGGVLTFVSAPDFENADDDDSNNEYEVQVTATSGTESRVMTTTQDITVTVNNVSESTPNNPPEFTSSSTFSVNENIRNVGNVTASDSDTQDNVTSYSISGGADNARLSITNGGVLTFDSAPDFENPNDANSNNEYVVQVTATSGTGSREMSATQDITITVNNVSESTANSPPVIPISSTTLYIDENNIDVGTIVASDPDIQDRITGYKFINVSNFDQELFQITNEGVLTFKSPPDYENPSDYDGDNTYQFRVQVSSGIGSRKRTTNSDVYVLVDNVSDEIVNNPPAFTSSSTFSVNENNIGVGTVTASDSDTEDSVTGYNISGGADNARLSITGDGILTFVSAPDFENPNDADSDNEYEVQVTATSGTGSRVMTATQDITVTVTNVSESTPNNPPQFPTGVAYLDLDENLNGPKHVQDITASDDVNDTITYSIASCDRSKFSINSSNGEVFYIGSGEDFESLVRSGSTQFNCIIEASDGSLNDTIRLEVNVQDVNEAPVFTELETRGQMEAYFFDFDENLNGSSTPVFVGNATATDDDEDNLTYSFTTAQTKFEINSSTGEITYVGRGENQEDEDDFMTAVQVSDGTLNVSVNVFISVNGVNEAPSTPSAPTLSSPTPNSLFVSWTAPDNTGPDINDYDVQYRKGSSGAFTNRTHTDDSTNTTITSLDANTLYQVRILARNDEGDSNWSPTASFTTGSINIPPTFTSSPTFSVNENNINVGTVTANDSDTEDSVTNYSLSGGSDSTKFSITSGGVLTFVSAPDFEYPDDADNNNEYEIQVTATSGAGSRVMTATQDITVTVNNVSESTPNVPPVFTSNSTFSVQENNINVGTVIASDSDTEDSVTGYSISGGADNTRFSITNGGVLTFVSAPDFENANDYNGDRIYVVQVTATSGSGSRRLTAIQDITVTVNDVDETVPNDPPEFISNSTFSVNENNINVGTVRATDSDTQDSVTKYSISGGSDSTNFSITNSGILHFISVPDFENPTDANSDNEYEVQVTATSGTGSRVMTATQNIIITITNANESPIFTQNSYTFNISENVNGTSVHLGTVTANDPDSNSVITYSITVGDTNKFNINSAGEITYNGSGEDYERTKRYRLTVRASDGTNNVNSSVIININNLNDGEEFGFERNAYTFTLDENADGSSTPVSIGTVIAINSNGTATYSITEGDTSKFNIKSSSGVISYIGSGENYESETRQYNLTIKAADGTNEVTTDVTVNINNLNEANNQPLVARDDRIDITSGDTTSVLSNGITNVRDNDEEQDNEISPPRITLISDVKYGNLTLNENGTFIYRHYGNSTAEDNFMYSISDGNYSDNATVTITVQEDTSSPNVNRSSSSSSSTSRSGSSGGGSSGTRLNEGDPTEFNIRSGGSSVVLIIVEANERVNNVKIKARKLKNLPSSVDETPNDEIYEYIDITASRLDNDEISDAEIEFIVDKEWLSDNGFDKDEIIMLIYNEDDDEWEDLDTEVIGENSEEVRYSAETSGFAIFSIVAREKPDTKPQKPIVETTPETQIITNETETNTTLTETRTITNETESKTIPVTTKPQTLSNLIIIIPLIALTLIVLVVVGSLIIKKSKSRRSGAKKEKKTRPITQTPAILSLEKTKSIATSPQYKTQPSTKYMKQKNISEQRKIPLEQTIISVILGIIILISGIVYMILFSEPNSIPSLEGIITNINLFIFISLIVVLATITVLISKITRDNSTKQSTRQTRQYTKPEPSPSSLSTNKTRRDSTKYSTKTVSVLSLILTVLILIILAIVMYMNSTAISNIFSAENLNTILFVSLIIVIIIIFGVEYKYKVFNELLFRESNTQKSKIL